MFKFFLSAAVVIAVGAAGYSVWMLEHQPSPETVVVSTDAKLTQRTIPVVDQTPQDARSLIILGRAELKALDTTMKQIKGKGWDVQVDCDRGEGWCDQHLYPDVDHTLTVTRTMKL